MHVYNHTVAAVWLLLSLAISELPRPLSPFPTAIHAYMNNPISIRCNCKSNYLAVLAGTNLATIACHPQQSSIMALL